MFRGALVQQPAQLELTESSERSLAAEDTAAGRRRAERHQTAAVIKRCRRRPTPLHVSGDSLSERERGRSLALTSVNCSGVQNTKHLEEI